MYVRRRAKAKPNSHCFVYLYIVLSVVGQLPKHMRMHAGVALTGYNTSLLARHAVSTWNY